jgi:hypothetical protein
MSRPSPLAHIRTIRVEAARVGDSELQVTGHLLDERPRGEEWFGLVVERVVHDMTLTVRVRYPDLVITAVSGTMSTRPYTLCTDAVPPLQQLVGLSVARGFTRALNERLGRQHGCAHLTALAHAMAPVVKQGAGAAFRDERAPAASASDPWFVNTCQAWREGGPLHTKLLEGDVEALRALSTRAPR